MKKNLLITLCALMAATCSVAVASPQDDLRRYLPPEQINWLEAEGDARYLALYKEPMVNFARGSMVSIPDWRRHPLQSPLIAHTYQVAPDLGWHSWSLLPPAEAIEPNRLQQPQASSNYPKPVDTSYFEPHISALADRLTRLNTELGEQPGFNVWVVEGMTAALAVKLLIQQPDLMPDALVVIDMYLPQVQLNKGVSRQLAQLQLPVLDIYSQGANSWVQNSKQQRHQFSQKYQQINYRQRQLLGAGQLAQQELASTLKGWLKHQGL
ncbi:DUF3530 family protein [Idiomarina seosinensis]|uniref:DUF3530 domain-containing protein n=1 Tax=Idiomarina seosinensis TaxID=281739 RepID=A0A432ZBC0_9GAMM|nr:DUF3530 family protein [Idiomarina seosinensis]RUO75199.1 DUF3530 domain-containing protein [Idiomarina seosinensis]